ncbi:MAG: thermitase, partial [Gaiellaceae bacterium]|nr:thermitase [Gaiellaceae bacterium]
MIAVVDSGVDLSHPDLSAKLVAGATFSGCADRPNGCGNGDWRSGNTTDPPSPHGTHVAGIAAASTNNGIGVAGVADARIMPVKALTEAGGSFEEIAAGIRWAVDHNADVITMSLGALPGVHTLVITGLIPDVADAIAHAYGPGIPVLVVLELRREAGPERRGRARRRRAARVRRRHRVHRSRRQRELVRQQRVRLLRRHLDG